MVRFSLALVAIASAGAAQSAEPSGYSAVPVAAPAETSFITRNLAWRWQGGAFVASRGTDRDLIVCQLVAKQVGALQSFTVDGEAMGADLLAKCNARAK